MHHFRPFFSPQLARPIHSAVLHYPPAGDYTQYAADSNVDDNHCIDVILRRRGKRQEGALL